MIIPEEVEEDLAEWFRSNPVLYDRTEGDWKNTQYKNRLYEEKGASLKPPVTGSNVKHWLETMRTQFGKLVKVGPSGSGTKLLTARE